MKLMGPATGALRGLSVYPASWTETDSAVFVLARSADGARRLCILGDATGFDGERQDSVLLCDLTAENAVRLRSRLPWLRPRPLGLGSSMGYGDRLGLATPGHVQAAQQFEGIGAVFAQQSVRENDRTGRSPQQVLDDAMWGVFQTGWHLPWGADADHLKTVASMDPFIEAGYTLYTIDPGDHVDPSADTASPAEVRAKVEALPWDALEGTPRDVERWFLTGDFDLGDMSLSFDQETVYRAMAKYGRAIVHTAKLYRYLASQMCATPFELEISVDETATPTSPEEHYIINSELIRMGVAWVSLAPRYTGRFEKGVDYIGPGPGTVCSPEDLAALEAEIAKHAAIARAIEPYKLSLHSGSDKLSIYPIFAKHTDGLFHVKTAGTSYLEALRTLAMVDPGLFRSIVALTCARYEADRVTYHVSAELSNMPEPTDLDDSDLASLLDQFDSRQVMHVTFGSVLDRFGRHLRATLDAHEDTYAESLRRHFIRHLSSLAR